MATICESVLIRRSPEEVFAFACEYQNDPLWRRGVVEMAQEPSPPTRRGVRTREVLRLAGQTVVTTAEVTDHLPGERMAFRSLSGPIPVEGDRTLRAAAGGTRFTYRVISRPSGFYRWIDSLLMWSFRKQVLRDLQRLRQLLEAEGRP